MQFKSNAKIQEIKYSAYSYLLPIYYAAIYTEPLRNDTYDKFKIIIVKMKH